MFQSVKEMSASGPINADVVDRLVWTAVFGADAELRGTARFNLRTAAAAAGIQYGPAFRRVLRATRDDKVIEVELSRAELDTLPSAPMTNFVATVPASFGSLRRPFS